MSAGSTTTTRRGWRIGAAAWALLFVVASGPVAPAPRTTDADTLRAALLFNFTRFVEWPADAFARGQADFRICVYGSDPFGARLDALRERRVGERPIDIAYPRTADELDRCQIAYLGAQAPGQVVSAAISGGAPRTLFVSSEASFVDAGGMFALVAGGGRVRLQVNLATVRTSPLRISAKLLEVAERRGSG